MILKDLELSEDIKEILVGMDFDNELEDVQKEQIELVFFILGNNYDYRENNYMERKADVQKSYEENYKEWLRLKNRDNYKILSSFVDTLFTK